MDQKPNATVTIGPARFGNDLPLSLIAGPCALESKAHALEMAAALKEIAARVGVGFVYKTSFDKANRTAGDSFRGPGYWNLDLGLFKTLRLKEWATLQLRAEVYNVFNHANLFVSGAETDISRFAYVPAHRDGRRNIQFAIRIIF